MARRGAAAVPAAKRGFAMNREAAKRAGAKGGVAPRDWSSNKWKGNPELARVNARLGGIACGKVRRNRKKKSSRWNVK